MINQCLTEIFGCNPENFKEIGEKVNKMVWEQVLLLMLYTRQQLIEQDRIEYSYIESIINFKNKIKLIELLFNGEDKKKYESIRNKILEKIEKYEDINQITIYLYELSSKKDSNEATSAGILLNDIANNHISFTSKNYRPFNNKHPYTYYSMFVSLKDAVPIFTNLINESYSEKYLSEIYLGGLKETYCSNYILDKDPLYNFKKSLQKINKLEEIEESISTLNKEAINNINKEAINNKINAFFSKKMGSYMTDLFSFIKGEVNKGDRISQRRASFFENIAKEDQNLDENGNKILRINEHALNQLIAMGKGENIILAIRNILLDRRSPRDKYHSKLSDETAFKEIIEWYEKCKTQLCNSILRDCPRLIVSILEFDCRNQVGIFDPINGIKINIENELKFAKDRYLLITGFIHRFLFKNGNLEELSYPNGEDKEKFIVDYINKFYSYDYGKELLDKKLEELPHFENRMMAVWADLEFNEPIDKESEKYKAMMGRFKKLPPYLKEKKDKLLKEEPTDSFDKEKTQQKNEENWHIYNFIFYQKEASKKVSYPLDSSFPLPLWSNLQFSDEENI